jgi:hypothetical protein
VIFSTQRGDTIMPRGVRIHEFGGPDVLEIEDVAQPMPGPGEVGLRVKAIGLLGSFRACRLRSITHYNETIASTFGPVGAAR